MENKRPDDPLQFIEALAERARMEEPPRPSVSYAAIARLNDGPEESAWPVLCFACGTALAAVWAAISSAALISAITDPIASLLQLPPLYFM